MPSALESLTTDLDRACMDTLGDTISYKAAGAGTFSDVLAHADYRDSARSFDGAEVIAQDMRFAVLMSDVPAKPTGEVRVQLPKVAGRTFKPVGVGRDESGTHWEFDLKDVTGG